VNTSRHVVLLVLLAGSPAPGECLPSGRATFAAGVEALGRGDLQTAEERFDELVKTQPNCAEARNNLAVVLFEMGRSAEANAQLRHALAINPGYRRARFNLQSVEGDGEGREPKLHAEAAANGDATPVPPVAATSAAPPPAISAPPAAGPARTPVPPNLAALEPQGATASVVDGLQKQLCVYRRTATAIIREACYPIVGSAVDDWPQWTVPSDVTARRVRLVDDTLRRRLRIIPTDVDMDDSVVVRRPDFDALSHTVVPWRTGFVVLPAGQPALEPAVAARSAQQVRDTIEQWRQAWEGKQFDAYIRFYGASFVPHPERDTARWRARKQTLFGQAGVIAVQIGAPSVYVLGDGATVITVFDQQYRAPTGASHDVKAVRWERQGERWLISAETILAASDHPARHRPRHGG
jgi:ketosteroid isomerase-like protein